jgi:hypothetical protein
MSSNDVNKQEHGWRLALLSMLNLTLSAAFVLVFFFPLCCSILLVVPDPFAIMRTTLVQHSEPGGFVFTFTMLKFTLHAFA